MTQRKYHEEHAWRNELIDCDDKECFKFHHITGERGNTRRAHFGPRVLVRRYVSEWEPVP